MKIRLSKKSIIMTPYIILVAVIIALGTTHAHAERPIMGENMEHLVAAFLQGGPSSHTIGGPGLSILNAEEHQEIMAGGDALANVFVTVINLGKGPIQLVQNEGSEVLETIGPYQTKAVFVLSSGGLTSLLGLIGDGIALWRVDILSEVIDTP